MGNLGAWRTLACGLRRLLPGCRDAMSLAVGMMETIGDLAAPVLGDEWPNIAGLKAVGSNHDADEYRNALTLWNGSTSTVIIQWNAGELE